jgi:C4-dicarboxylate-binding protein DctP
MVDRRTVLKTAGVAGLSATLAGCSAILEDDGGSTSGESAGDLGELPEMEITYAHSGNTDISNHQHRAAVTFKNHIESRTNGNFTVNISPGGELGSLVDVTEQNIDGTIEVVGSTAEGHLAPFYPNINVYALPYAFRNVEVANYVFDKEFGDQLWADFRDQTGLRMLTWYDNGGFRCFSTGNTPIRSMEDFDGLTFRTMQIEAHQELVRSLGANPEPIDWGELYQALDQGVVDGQENSVPTFISGKFEEVQDHLILDNHVFTMNFIHCNDGWFQGLPSGYQEVVRQAGYLATKDARMVNRVRRETGISYVESQGVEVYDPPQDLIDDMAEATQEPVRGIIEEEMDDPGMVDDMLDAIQQAEEDLGYV